MKTLTILSWLCAIALAVLCPVAGLLCTVNLLLSNGTEEDDEV